MTNIYFKDEMITENDLYFLCYMIERVARKLHQRNKYIVNTISREEWMRLISLASVLHCENPLKVEDEWIKEYQLEEGDFDIMDTDSDLVTNIPTETQINDILWFECDAIAQYLGFSDWEHLNREDEDDDEEDED